MRWKPKENICWVGDSITATGEFINNIWRFLLIKNPNMQLYFRNCGTPGDSTKHVINRFEYDILPKQPDQAIIMLGMNDSSVGLYNQEFAENKQHNDEVVAEYGKNIRNLIGMFEEQGVELVLCTPTPFDDTVDLDAENFQGRNSVLGRFSQVIKEIAMEKGILVVDFWSKMTECNQKFQNINPKFTLNGLDRVHPDSVGHSLMSYIFLKEIGFEIDDKKIGAGNSKKLTNAINEKHSIEIKLRSMNMIRRSMSDMGYSNNQYQDFKEEYIKSIEGKSYRDYCISTLELYEANIQNELNMQKQVEKLINYVNKVSREEG